MNSVIDISIFGTSVVNISSDLSIFPKIYKWCKDKLVDITNDDGITYVKSSNGVKTWYKNKSIHRDGDLPAIITDDHQVWCKNDMLHRENDLPAVEYFDGDKYWYKLNKIHRDNDLPAIVTGTYRVWFKNGKLYRDNDLPVIVFDNGEEYYFSDNKFHKRECTTTSEVKKLSPYDIVNNHNVLMSIRKFHSE